MKGNRKINNMLTEFKAKYYALSEEYRIFNMELQFADTNPVIPVLKLILGIIFFITTILWIIQMYASAHSVFSGTSPRDSVETGR